MTNTVTGWDDQGHPTGWVTVSEPRFDVEERDSWYALWEYEQAVCPHCGNLRAVCTDPDRDWYPQLDRCWASAARAVVDRRYQKRHENARPDAAGYLPTDGAVVWVSPEDLTPGDNFLGDHDD